MDACYAHCRISVIKDIDYVDELPQPYSQKQNNISFRAIWRVTGIIEFQLWFGVKQKKN